MKCDRCDQEATFFVQSPGQQYRFCPRCHVAYCQDVLDDNLADQAERELEPPEEA